MISPGYCNTCWTSWDDQPSNDLHMHMGGIKYNMKGELNHLPLAASDFNYPACLQALKDFRVKGCVIAEGPLVEQDALLLKNSYRHAV